MGDPARGSNTISISALALYDPAEHRPLATRFGQDVRVAALSYRSMGSLDAWLSRCRAHGCRARAQDAREINQAAELMHALFFKAFASILCGNYAAAKAEGRELVALADEKDSAFFRKARNDGRRSDNGPYRQSRECHSNSQWRNHRVRVQLEQRCSFRFIGHIWRGLMLNLIGLKCLALHCAKR